MKIDPRDIEIWTTVWTVNEWKIHKMEISSLWDKVLLVARPLCFLPYFDNEDEAKELAKKQLQSKIDSL